MDEAAKITKIVRWSTRLKVVVGEVEVVVEVRSGIAGA